MVSAAMPATSPVATPLWRRSEARATASGSRVGAGSVGLMRMEAITPDGFAGKPGRV